MDHKNTDGITEINQFGEPICQVFRLEGRRSVHLQQLGYRDEYRVTIIDDRITLMYQKTITLLDYIKLIEFLRQDHSPAAMIEANKRF